jgi:CBS domain-containing protein
MTTDLSCCVAEDTVDRAARIMRDGDVGPVPVVNNQSENRLVGIVTDRDIAIKVVAAGRDAQTTRVRDVMSENLVTCGPEDHYTEALDAMASNQVRRVLIVNGDGTLAGIISQADVARRSSEEEVGEVVEEISEPAGLSGRLRSFTRSSGAGDRDSGFDMGALFMGAACLSFGAGIMYMLDPDRGSNRRARVRDKAAGLYTDSGYYAGKVQRDLRNRATGMAASVKSSLRREDEPSNQTLEARVRSKLGRLTSHPHAIHVRADNGRITLEGPVLASEAGGMISALRGVAGVRELDDRLTVHEHAGNISSLQGSSQVRREQWEFMQSNWSPAARLVASAVGGGLAIYGLKASGPLAKATCTLGFGLLARGLSNKEVSSWADFSGARRAIGF